MTNILRLPQVLERVGFGRTVLYGLIRENKFPAPIKISARLNGWPEHAIDEWIAARVAASAPKAEQPKVEPSRSPYAPTRRRANTR